MFKKFLVTVSLIAMMSNVEATYRPEEMDPSQPSYSNKAHNRAKYLESFEADLFTSVNNWLSFNKKKNYQDIESFRKTDIFWNRPSEYEKYKGQVAPEFELSRLYFAYNKKEDWRNVNFGFPPFQPAKNALNLSSISVLTVPERDEMDYSLAASQVEMKELPEVKEFPNFLRELKLSEIQEHEKHRGSSERMYVNFMDELKLSEINKNYTKEGLGGSAGTSFISSQNQSVQMGNQNESLQLEDPNESKVVKTPLRSQENTIAVVASPKVNEENLFSPSQQNLEQFSVFEFDDQVKSPSGRKRKETSFNTANNTKIIDDTFLSVKPSPVIQVKKEDDLLSSLMNKVQALEIQSQIREKEFEKLKEEVKEMEYDRSSDSSKRSLMKSEYLPEYNRSETPVTPTSKPDEVNTEVCNACNIF